MVDAPACTGTRAGTCAYRREPNLDGNVQSVSDPIECPGHSNGTNAARSNPYGWERAERCEPNNRGERRIVLDRPYPNGFNQPVRIRPVQNFRGQNRTVLARIRSRQNFDTNESERRSVTIGSRTGPAGTGTRSRSINRRNL